MTCRVFLNIDENERKMRVRAISYDNHAFCLDYGHKF